MMIFTWREAMQEILSFIYKVVNFPLFSIGKDAKITVAETVGETEEIEVNCAFVRKFRENGIEIPIPQRDLHVRSSLPLPMVSN